jgi:hypothetical protein
VTDDATHLSARWTIAPLVSSILVAIARDRRCDVSHLSATLTSEVETAALAWYAAYLQDNERTPVRDLWESDRASKVPTVPASPPPVPPPPMPKGVKR